MLSTVLSLATEAEHHTELPMSEWGFGGVALGFFGLMLAALWSFRGTAQKVPTDDAGHGDAGHGAHDEAHGRAHH